ncbi:FMRFamide receptor [Osmia bicornis bicornis]|uniref:FMRFamide receptor n=1 Tax=Osmia bicornis bicornis TaxID=1437191 RepID=UPI0010F6667A|nr:FMRFamide receptor [Osmia bicornis bicornis]XP_029032936.1 FMRFamide receptor [Osmia bicornis bicornis]
METSFETFNATSYYDAGELLDNSSINENLVKRFECKGEINTTGLFDFIIYGVLINLVSIFGIFGNAISMIILSRPQMKSSINYLLIGLARCDTVLIISSVLIYGLPAIYGYTGLLFNYKFIIYPKIVRFLYPLSCMAQIATVYLTLTVTLERYIAVCHPLKARSFCTYGRAQLAVLVIVIFTFIYNLPKFWEVEVYPETHWKYKVTIYCLRPANLRSSNLYVTLYVHWMYFFICYLFPFLALVIFNAAIYQRVRKANRDLQQLSRHQRREIGLATMLLCVVIVFLICNILPLASNIHETSFVTDPPLWLVETGNLLVTINSSINFIIYVIFGRKFKRIFLKLFCSSNLFGPGRDSPEFQTYDESIVTNMTNLEPRNSIRNYHLNRSSTIRNNNVPNGSTRRSLKISGRPASPGPCVYYPARSPVRSPSQMSRTSSGQNGWSKKDMDSVL